jgi:uncharacterized protein YqjF (DUF2071 family)
MVQRWHDLLFAHWPVSVPLIRALVPKTLTVDTFEGRAWVGVVPFHMSGVRIRGMPALPGLSAFPELNVRTYVTAGNRPGVWFFSLDASNRIAVEIARRWFALPYLTARMIVDSRDGWIAYESRRTDRRGREATFVGRYRPAAAPFHSVRGTLDHWLTERYCLYAVRPDGALHRAEIHHRPWPLQSAEAELLTNTMARATGIELPDQPPILHFAGRLDVTIWRPHRIGSPRVS